MKGTLSVAAVLLSSLLQPPDLFPSESTPIDTTAGIRAIAARALAVGDLDLDGSDDVVVTNLFGWAVCVFLADGTQSYTPVWHYGTEAGPFSVALGDLNNDGVPDIVAVSGTNGNVFVLLGNGDGTFEEAGTYHSGIRTPSLVAVADLNRDGSLDVFTAHQGGKAFSALFGTGDGTLEEARTYDMGNLPLGSSNPVDFGHDKTTSQPLGKAGTGAPSDITAPGASQHPQPGALFGASEARTAAGVAAGDPIDRLVDGNSTTFSLSSDGSNQYLSGSHGTLTFVQPQGRWSFVASQGPEQSGTMLLSGYDVFGEPGNPGPPFYGVAAASGQAQTAYVNGLVSNLGPALFDIDLSSGQPGKYLFLSSYPLAEAFGLPLLIFRDSSGNPKLYVSKEGQLAIGAETDAAPIVLTTANQTLCTHLNADLLDGHHADDLLALARNADTLDGYHADDFARSSHAHDRSIAEDQSEMVVRHQPGFFTLGFSNNDRVHTESALSARGLSSSLALEDTDLGPLGQRSALSQGPSFFKALTKNIQAQFLIGSYVGDWTISGSGSSLADVYEVLPVFLTRTTVGPGARLHNWMGIEVQPPRLTADAQADVDLCTAVHLRDAINENAHGYRLRDLSIVDAWGIHSFTGGTSYGMKLLDWSDNDYVFGVYLDQISAAKSVTGINVSRVASGGTAYGIFLSDIRGAGGKPGYGIYSEADALFEDGWTLFLGTNEKVGLSSSIDNQLDLTPYTPNSDVTVEVIGSGKLTGDIDAATLQGTSASEFALALTREVDGHVSRDLGLPDVSTTTIYNTGQGPEDVALSLPPCTAGANFLLVVGTSPPASHKWGILADRDDKIYLDGVAGVDHGSVYNYLPRVGDTLACFAFKTATAPASYDWNCRSVLGTWTAE